MRKFDPCHECTGNHQCGAEQCRKQGECNQCGYEVIEISPNVYLCHHAKQIISIDQHYFENYVSKIKEEFSNFCAEHEERLYELTQRKLSGTIEGQDPIDYDTISTFGIVQSWFRRDIPPTLQLRTAEERHYAYQLAQAFDRIKRLKLQSIFPPLYGEGFSIYTARTVNLTRVRI